MHCNREDFEPTQLLPSTNLAKVVQTAQNHHFNILFDKENDKLCK